MTRPASFNTTWANAGQQVAGESDTKTQEFMKTGWEGGSDKKPPHAPTQNYHMQKTDLALQEIERQGLLSWRNDVPYQKGARVFWHGSTFQALKDTTGTEPQGSGDNGTWYLVPIQNYPSSYESVHGLGTAAKHNEGDFDRAGTAQAVKDSLREAAYCNVYKGFGGGAPYDENVVASAKTVRHLDDWVVSLKNSLSRIATSGLINDAVGVLAKEHGGLGRNDGNVDAGSIYVTGTSLTSSGLKFVNVPASDGEANKICAGKDDNGSNVDLEASINVDSWRGVAFRSSYDGFKTTYIIDARTGDVNQRGGIALGAGESGADRGIECRSGGVYVGDKQGGYIRVADGVGFAHHKPGGEPTFRVVNGKIWQGTIALAQVEGAGNAAGQDVYDDSDPTHLQFNGRRPVSEATAKGVYEHRNDGLGQAAYLNLDKGVRWDKLSSDESKTLNLRQFVEYRDESITPGKVNSRLLAMIADVNDERTHENGDTIRGELLTPADCAGGVSEGKRFEGIWVCEGRIRGGSKQDNWAKRVTMWSRRY